ncbi:MAG: lysophospholipid acyltransferase family protein [Anaerolineales bacterium]
MSEKPRSEHFRPELTRLPELNWIRRGVRSVLRGLVRLVLLVTTRIQAKGLENIPRERAALVVFNHLGDVDGLIMLSVAPVSIDFIAKIELYDIPVLGALLEAYGVIWVHRGRPDRRALHAALNGLAEGRLVAVAPEGRESLSGSLEEGTGGAAYIALKADVPILPVTFTGTENLRVYGNLKRFRRTEITATVGRTFRLERGKYLREAVQEGTQRIMRKLALQLPKGYRGVYQGAPEDR